METLKWDITYKVKKEYTDNLTFILGPHMDKLPTDLVAEIAALPGECGMEVNSTSCHVPKATPSAADDVGNGKVEAAGLSVVT